MNKQHHRSYLWIGFIFLLVVTVGCKKKASPDDTADDSPQTISETEPNDERERCESIPDGKSLIGSVVQHDVDTVCIGEQRIVYVTGGKEVSLVLEDGSGQRAMYPESLHPTNARRIVMPGRDWVMRFNGDGDWSVHGPVEDEEEETRCGIDLGNTGNAVELSMKTFPASFPVCVHERAGHAIVQLPLLRPQNSRGFVFSIDGVNDHTRGTVHVRDASTHTTILSMPIGPSFRTPALNWPDDATWTISVTIGQEEGRSTAFLRVDEIERPEDPRRFMELEPNDNPDQAIRIPGPGVVSATLHNLQDVDWFELDSFAGGMTATLKTQQETDIRLQRIVGEEKATAVKDKSGAYVLCEMYPTATEPARVRVSYADDAKESDGFYQLSFESSEVQSERTTPMADIVLPNRPPRTEFGFVQTVDDEETHVLQKDARVFPPDAAHAWVFEVPMGLSTMPVELTLHPKSAMDVRMRILDEERVLVANANAGSIGEDEHVRMDLPPGFYYVEIAARGVNACDGLYTLQLRHAAEAERDSDNAKDEQEHDANGADDNHPTDKKQDDAAPNDEKIPTNPDKNTGSSDEYPW